MVAVIECIPKSRNCQDQRKRGMEKESKSKKKRNEKRKVKEKDENIVKNNCRINNFFLKKGNITWQARAIHNFI